MSTSTTFTTLLEDARRYLERGFTAESDPVVYEQLPRLITQAQRRIARELKIQGFIRAVSTPLSIGVAVYLKPDRWRDTVSMSVNGKPLFARTLVGIIASDKSSRTPSSPPRLARSF